MNTKKIERDRLRSISLVLIFKITRGIAIFFFCSFLITFFYETIRSEEKAEKTLKTAIEGFENTTAGFLEEDMFNIADKMLDKESDDINNTLYYLDQNPGEYLDENGNVSVEKVNQFLAKLCQSNGLDEINIISHEGVVMYSTDGNNVGSDIYSDFEKNDTAYYFLYNTKNAGVYIQDVAIEENESENYMKCLGMLFNEDCFIAPKGSVLELGYNEENVDKVIAANAAVYAQSVNIGQNGLFVVLEENENENDKYKVIGGNGISPFSIMEPDNKGEYINFSTEKYYANERYEIEYKGFDYYMIYDIYERTICLALYPVSEAKEERNLHAIVFLLEMFFLFVILDVAVYIILRKEIIKPIQRINTKMDKISSGDLDTVVDVLNNQELSMLSDDINIMVVMMKKYIREAAARLDEELAVAKAIQLSAVPHTFPPFPDRKEFDIYGTMETAKEVGGDFFDFFFVDDDHFAMVIADVSDKGIPAAMFMMTAKASIRDRALQGGSPAQILFDVNNTLCNDNLEKMFVTVWLCIIDLSTGEGIEANAGHEHPTFCTKGSYRLVKYPHSPPLALMPNMPFTDRKYKILEGDSMFVYTDGVTDAVNAEGERFGEDGLLSVLNDSAGADPEQTILTVKKAIGDFTSETDQFDDITICAFRYNGNNNG